MAIGCQKCGYVMTPEEAFGYMSAEACHLFKNIILPALIAMYMKKGLNDLFVRTRDGLILSFLNYNEVKCHVCHAYNGWSVQQMSENKNIQEKELR